VSYESPPYKPRPLPARGSNDRCAVASKPGEMAVSKATGRPCRVMIVCRPRCAAISNADNCFRASSAPLRNGLDMTQSVQCALFHVDASRPGDDGPTTVKAVADAETPQSGTTGVICGTDSGFHGGKFGFSTVAPSVRRSAAMSLSGSGFCCKNPRRARPIA
jgi:hypothetical protein